MVNVLYVAMYGQQSPALEIKRGGGIWSWETRARPYLPSLAALRHAVFTTLAMIAPVKPFISAEPDILELPCRGKDRKDGSAGFHYSFAIIGTDGLWDVVSNGQAAAIVVAAIERGLTLEQAAEQLICAAGGKACEDNATALVVFVDNF